MRAVSRELYVSVSNGVGLEVGLAEALLGAELHRADRVGEVNQPSEHTSAICSSANSQG